MASEEDYARNAKDAQEWAERATSAEDRQGWLRIARGWLDLMRKSQQAFRLPRDRQPEQRVEGHEFPKSGRVQK